MIVSDGLSFFAGSAAATRLWQLRICSCQAIGSIPGTGEERDAHDCCRQVCILQTGSLVRLAWCLDDRQTSHFDRLASQCIPPFGEQSLRNSLTRNELIAERSRVLL
jgi:hypothetical protein